MAKLFSNSQRASATSGHGPPVRLEVRTGSAKPFTLDVPGEEFLIGSVPGCDLRLPGTNLPPVVCMILRQQDGVRLRKLSPALPVLLNGQPVSASTLSPLTHGDMISIGPVDIRVDIAFIVGSNTPPMANLVPSPANLPVATPVVSDSVGPAIEERLRLMELEDVNRRQEWVRRQQELDQRQKLLDEQQQELEADRVLWYRRREELEQEFKQTKQEIDRLKPTPEEQNRWTVQRAELENRQKEVDRQTAEIQKSKDEVDRIRKELYEQFRQRRDQLASAQTTLLQQQEVIKKRELELENNLLRMRQETESELYQRRQQAEREFLERKQQLEAELKEREDQLRSSTTPSSEQQTLIEKLTQELQEKNALLSKQQQAETDLQQKRDDFEKLVRIKLEEIAQQMQKADEELKKRREMFLSEKQQIEKAQIERWEKSEKIWESRLAEKEAEFQKEKQLLEADVKKRLLDAELLFRERKGEFVEEEQAMRLRLEKELRDKYRQRTEELDQFQIELRDIGLDLKSRRDQLEQEIQEFKEKTYAFQQEKEQLLKLQTELEEQQHQLKNQEEKLGQPIPANELEERAAQIRKDAAELEEQVRQMDEKREQLRIEEERIRTSAKEQDDREAKLNERLAQIESQQVMLATLRTRMEEMREEVRQQATQIAEDRSRQMDLEQQLIEKQRELELLREQLSTEQSAYIESSKTLNERSGIMHQAVQRMRELQQQLSSDDERLRKWATDLEVQAAQQLEQSALIKAKGDQLFELQQRLEADRESLRLREMALSQNDSSRSELQEQLLLRSEAIAQKEKTLEEQTKQLQTQAEQIQQQLTELERLRTDAISSKQHTEDHSELLQQQAERLAQMELALEENKRQLEQVQTLRDKQQQEAQTEIESLRQALAHHASSLFQEIPDLEQRAAHALEQTAAARDQIRQQLAELHKFARQSQEDLETLRSQVQAEMQTMRQQETDLHRAKTEHRLAVTSFKQQLIEWQSRFAEMKQNLTQNDARIVQREAEVEATTQHLAKQMNELQQKQQEVEDRRSEMERHLGDMREWYRKKLREIIANRSTNNTRLTDDSEILPLPPTADRPNSATTGNAKDPVILTLTDDLDPGDKRLGELLRSLELVDADTLMALWNEARKQRRPLRQVLLTGGYLTLYQLALIESGNLHKLMLGRFRVVDRLLYSSREIIYRVSDPQKIGEGTCVLRHLSESEMQDPVRPDEYRQRFAAVRDIAHPNIAATLEILELNQRPAVVQEWLSGLPGNDWPVMTAVPGVWFRLLSQAAVGLHTVHSGGMVHGRLQASSFLLTGEGTVKILGLGEPPWLNGSVPAPEPTPQDDLKALGQVAVQWSQIQAKTKKAKTKPFSPELMGILLKLGADTGAIAETDLYRTVAELLDDLDQISNDISADSSAWEKLLEYVRENKTEGLLRQSA